MRGFRTGRAVQNSKSAQMGKQSHLKLIQGGLSEQQNSQPQKTELPSWLRVPQSVIDAQKGARPDAFGVNKVSAAPKRKVVRLVTARKKAVAAKRVSAKPVSAKRTTRKTAVKRKAA